MVININFSCFIYTMNKLLKYTLVGIASIITIIPSFSFATPYHGGAVGIQLTSVPFRIDLTSYTCYTTDTENTYTYSFNGSTFNAFGKWDLVCGRAGDTIYFGGQRNGRILSFPGIPVMTSSQCQNEYSLIPISSVDQNYCTSNNLCPPQYTKTQCKSVYGLIEDSECVGMDSMECQTTYNLIPISEVTPNYCALNFDMIDPSECPINEGTGAIVRSNLMINDVPYAQNQNINVFIPDFIQWNIAFNDLYTNIEVEGYNADTDYIEDVINKEKLTPTNEDFANMLVGLANFFPYLAIAFIMFYIVKLIYKLFK